MNEENIIIRLAETIANIEERTDSELISVIKDTLIAVGTGMRAEAANGQYKVVYKELDNRLAKHGSIHPNQFDDLWSFIDYWKENSLDTYSSRRSFIRNLYRSERSSDDDGFWDSINPTIRGVAKSRFESKHYSDAVEASFKEINSRVKEEVRQRSGEVLDGASLMNFAFSIKKPVIVLEDQGTEDGRNIQVGYMQMFAGAMTAVRNPKAHSNTEIEPEEAIPLIQLASLLFAKFESAISRDKNIIPSEPKAGFEDGLYLWVVDPDNTQILLDIKKIAHDNPGDTSITLALGDKKSSAIRLPFAISTEQAVIEKLKRLLGDKKVINVIDKKIQI